MQFEQKVHDSPDSPLVSIVIPTHNSSGYIETAITSITSSTKDILIEIILVDDASSDINDLKKIASQNKTIKLIEKKNKGNAAESRNVGFFESKGQFVFFLDSDDSYTESHIKRRLALHQANDYGVIFGNFVERQGMIDTKIQLPIYNYDDIRNYIFSQGGDIRSSTISINKTHHKGTIFDFEQYKHQDWGYAIRAFDQGEKIFFDQAFDVIIDNTQNPSRMSSGMNISASAYFLSRYVKDANHIFRFVQGHLKLTVMSKDKKAMRFLRSLLSSIMHDLTWRNRTRAAIFFLAIHPPLSELTNFLYLIKTTLKPSSHK